MNALVRSVLYDVGGRRQHPNDPSEVIFSAAYRTTARAFEQAAKAARATLSSAGKDGGHLDGFTWHGLRHTWASRLSMAGVDARTLQELGGWQTLSMVERYAHLSPDHLRAALDRLVSSTDGAVQLGRNLDEPRQPQAAPARGDEQVCENQGTEG